jgi:dTDP-glucose pyrophosphorylase
MLSSKKKKLTIQNNLSFIDVMKAMDEGGEKILFVINRKSKLLGCVTDGDIRRWILAKGTLEAEIADYFNPNPISINNNYNSNDLKSLVIRERITAVPVIDNKNKLIDILLSSEIVNTSQRKIIINEKIDVVIMAGGKGTRLNPFTHVLPKPLIPINGKPVIQIILDRLIKYNLNQFYISLNEKSKILKAYFHEENFKVKIDFILEKKKLGTIGALNLIKEKVSETFFVVNCDTLLDVQYNEIYNFHKENNYDLTIVGCVKEQEIPYGVCQLDDSGLMSSIIEKPNHSFIANTGFYVFNNSLIDLIPRNKSYNMDELIENIILNKGKIGLFPIGHDSWNDIGNWLEYKKTSKVLKIE